MDRNEILEKNLLEAEKLAEKYVELKIEQQKILE